MSFKFQILNLCFVLLVLSWETLSAALMLRFSFGLEEAAADIEKAVRQAIDDGFRTRDIGSEGPGIQLTGTAGMGEAVLARL